MQVLQSVSEAGRKRRLPGVCRSLVGRRGRAGAPAESMRRFLRQLALGLALLSGAVWLATGAHRGWTHTEITEMRLDAITGIEYPETRKGFVAGLDLLGGGLGVAAVLAGLSFCGRTKKSCQTER